MKKKTPCIVPTCPNEAHAGGVCAEHWEDPRLGRYLAEARFPEIDEQEAIAYARGYARGLIMAGIAKEKAIYMMCALAVEDRLLDAGNTFMGVNMIESLMNTRH